jgi:signal transduction histidine kinase
MEPVGKPAPFLRLERQVRRLQWLAIVLVAVIALLPPSLFIVLQLNHLHTETERHARHLSLLVAAEVARTGPDVGALRALLEREAAFGGLASLALVDPDGREVVHIGQGASLLPTSRIEVDLPASTAPLAEIAIAADDTRLMLNAARVLGIHLLVASLLALAVYRLPMRSVRNAIEEVEKTHTQLLHTAKLSAIGETYAGLAHEINNPLGILLSRVRLMRSAAGDRGFDAELVRDLEMIERHGSRIGAIVRGLLAFSRKTRFEPVDTDVNELLHEVIVLVEPPFTKHGVTIQAMLDPGLPRVAGSRDHLQQVFVNLLNNARDAMPGGGTVALRTYALNGDVVAEVEDSGAGVPPEVRARIFEPFFTTKDHGTGLGLSVSYGIVSAHGGTITAECLPGRGACFRISLPAAGTRA